MNINYNYKTYEDRLREQYEAYNQVIEKRATKNILNTAVDLFDQQQFDLCLKISEELEKTATNPKDLYDAKKMIALCYYAKKDVENSDEAFYNLAKDSNNSDDWFNGVIAAALNKNYTRSEEMFGTALEKFSEFGTERNMPSVQLIFHYMLTLSQGGEFDLAFEKFNLLRQVYEQVKTSQEKFLNQRGLNKISVFLENSREVLEKIDSDLLQETLEEFKTHLDDKGKLEVTNFQNSLA